MRRARIIGLFFVASLLLLTPAPAWALPNLCSCQAKNPDNSTLTLANCNIANVCTCDAGSEGPLCLMRYTSPLFTSEYQCEGNYCGGESCACPGAGCCFPVGCAGHKVECAFPVANCESLCSILISQALQACQGIGPGHPGGRCVGTEVGVNGHTAKFELCCPEGQVVNACGPGGTGDTSCAILGSGPPPTCLGQFKCNCPGVQISCGDGNSPQPTSTPTATAAATSTFGPGVTPIPTSTPSITRAPVQVRLRQ